MAGSSDLSKLTSFIDKFFRLFNNFIEGYQVKDNDVTKESDNVSTVLTLEGQGPEGNDVKIKLTATNIKSAFRDIISKISGLSAQSITPEYNNVDPDKDGDDSIDDILDPLSDNFEASTHVSLEPIFAAASLSSTTAKFLQDLLGEGCLTKNQDAGGQISYEGDITVSAAKSRNAGILGIDLNTVASKGKLTDPSFKLWRNIAFDTMRYKLTCECDGYDSGVVSDAKLIDCVVWINKYINVISNNAEASDVRSREDKLSDDRSKNTAALILVTPILDVIQSELVKMYEARLNSSASELDKLIPGNEPKQDEDNSEWDSDKLKQNEANKTSEDTAEPTENTSSSQHINITLKKIEASDDVSIVKLYSNYSPSDTLSDIEDFISQEAFLSELSDEPQSFTISVDEEGFDVEKCDDISECNPCESLCEIFKAGIRAYRNLYILHWMSSGNDMMKLHNLSEAMYQELQSEFDTIGELLVEKQGTVPQLDFPCDYIPVQKYEFQAGLDQIKSLIQMYIDCIDYAYCNQDSDVQSTLDEWVRYWNKQLNYFVERQEN